MKWSLGPGGIWKDELAVNWVIYGDFNDRCHLFGLDSKETTVSLVMFWKQRHGDT
jgi:hypothetical protein